MADNETRTILCELKGGSIRKIEIPSTWRVTFGPIGVGMRFDRNNGEGSPNVLRIYSDVKKEHLMAVYRNVLSFTDQSVGLTERFTRKKQRTMYKDGANGKQAYQAEIRVTSWRDPFSEESDNEDVFDESILKLPGVDKDDDLPF